MVTKKIWFALAAVLAIAGAALATSYENSEDATAHGRNWRGRHFAPFEVDEGAVTGKYVSFQVDGNTIVDYSAVRNDTTRTIFTSIVLPDAPDKSGAKGALYGMKDDDYRAAIFNARNAGMFLQAKNASVVTYTLAEGISAEYHAGEPGWSPEGVKLTDAEGHSARLIVRGDASVTVDGNTIVVTLGEGAGVSFHIDGKPRELAAEMWLLHKLAKRERDGERPDPAERPERPTRAPRATAAIDA